MSSSPPKPSSSSKLSPKKLSPFKKGKPTDSPPHPKQTFIALILEDGNRVKKFHARLEGDIIRQREKITYEFETARSRPQTETGGPNLVAFLYKVELSRPNQFQEAFTLFESLAKDNGNGFTGNVIVEQESEDAQE